MMSRKLIILLLLFYILPVPFSLLKAQVVFEKDFQIKNQQQPTKFIYTGNSILIVGIEHDDNNNFFSSGYLMKCNLNLDTISYSTYIDSVESLFWDVVTYNEKIFIGGSENHSSTFSDSYLFCIDGTNNSIYNKKNFGWLGDGDVFTKILIDKQNNIYLIGWSVVQTGVNTDVQILKCDTNGNIIWKKYYGTNSNSAGVMDAFITSNNKIIAGGRAYEDNYTSLITGKSLSRSNLLCIDTSGKELWNTTYTFANTRTFAEQILGLCASSKNYISCGSLTDQYIRSYDLDYNYEALLRKVDDTGKVLWEKRFFNNPKYDKKYWYQSSFNKVQEDAAGNLLLLGTYTNISTQTDIGFVLKYNPEYDTIFWRIDFTKPNANFDAKDFIILEDGSMYVLLRYLTKYFTPTNNNTYIAKIDNTGCLTNECYFNKPNYNTEATVIPNPFTNVVNFQLNGDVSSATLLLYNSQGQLIVNETINTKTTYQERKYITYNGSKLPNGLYFYQVIAGGNVISKGKVVKQ